MYINKRIDHATAEIVEVGLTMQNTREAGYAQRFLRKLSVNDTVISRVLSASGYRRLSPYPPKKATFNFISRKRLDVVQPSGSQAEIPHKD
jgi:hypothetical protein